MAGVSKRRSKYPTSSPRKLKLGKGIEVDYPVPSDVRVSAVMRGNRKRDTKPELLIRRNLHSKGYRYRVNRPIQIEEHRVRPDIVFLTGRVAVFVDGCFWHGCPRHGTNPKNNPDYWKAKIARNKARDEMNTRYLKGSGWRVIRIWEHESVDAAVRKIERALRL